MREITIFVLPECPHCNRALKWMEQLRQENPAFGKIPLRIIDERMEPDFAGGHDYYYVPSIYIAGKKVHEGVASPDIIRNTCQMALEEG